jgi:hypothetical protein
MCKPIDAEKRVLAAETFLRSFYGSRVSIATVRRERPVVHARPVVRERQQWRRHRRDAIFVRRPDRVLVHLL